MLSLFTIAAREYEHIAFDASARATARTVILGVAIGIVLAALYNFYLKAVPGGVVRALLFAEALSDERAKSLADLGLARNPLYGFAVAHDLTLRRVLRRAENEAGEGERYYIPEDEKYRAQVRFESKGNGVVSLILSVAIAFAVAVLLIKLLPVLLGVIDGML
ncbi:MAG: hypothetical protein IJA78_04480 [Clostridia bacterium]|nr:hypothetical protein [Clostridia bacterium]